MFSRSVNNEFLCFLLAMCALVPCIVAETPGCTLLNKDSKSEKALLEGLHDLKGETFTVEDRVDGKLKDIYEIGVCASVNKSAPQVGAVQHVIGDKGNQTFMLGQLNSTTLAGAPGWTLVTYRNGDRYNGSCNNSSREVQLAVLCSPNEHHGTLQIASSGRAGETACSFLFVISSSVVCSKEKHEQHHRGLSGGAVFCILFFTVAGSYLLLGFLYKRIVVGAKGLEQIPNYSFWKDCGNLQADGCNYICRCQCDSSDEHRSYRDIDDRPLRPDEDRDDQLLTIGDQHAQGDIGISP
ncbi:cation-dependent mannose-6-phosphate receptor-like isoform X2 [Dermacentor albipictus]|uniref:cation-dependent mannose-6-phosphate receptor-like isoform X2 n=1 Tax=Dermacentor albipictus TaxID=60249 RepID=UPI0038FC747E